MTESELGRLLQRCCESLDISRRAKPTHGLELALGRSARANEVRVIGVRPSVRVAARRGDHRALLEGEHGLARAREREHGLDRVPALRVGDGMRRALGDGELDVRGRGDLTEKLC